MAIVRMKKLHVLAPAEQETVLLHGLLRLGCVEFSHPEHSLEDALRAALFQRNRLEQSTRRDRLAEVTAVLEAIRRYAGIRRTLLPRRSTVTKAVFFDNALAERAHRLCKAVQLRLNRLEQAQQEEAQLRSEIAELRPWQTLELPLGQTGTEHTRFWLGICPERADTQALRQRMAAETPAAALLEISRDREWQYLLAVVHSSAVEPVGELLRTCGFRRVSFPENEGTAVEEIRKRAQALEEARAVQDREAAAIAACSGEYETLQLYADRLRTEIERERCAAVLLTGQNLLFFQGWVPEEQAAATVAFLEENGCAWELADPTGDELAETPVLLKNNWFTEPLNMVTEMYALPTYDNVDPNPWMAPFFILFYGIMMADMGYGLLMLAAGVFVTGHAHPGGTMGNLFRLMTLCGVSTFIMGAVTGSFFGDFLTQAVKLAGGGDFALPALFTPLDDTLLILTGSMGLGVVQIVTGMAAGFLHKLKTGHIMDALWEEVTWWIVFAGIAAAVLGGTRVILYAGAVMAVVGPAVRHRGIGRLTGVAASLYRHITGYFGDILSYSRLMALMLAGNVIAQVFNTLGAIPGDPVIFILVSLLGNGLNFALNLLGCYVHDLRLQCLEFFGKFYKDGGRPFRPLAPRTRYVNLKDL